MNLYRKNGHIYEDNAGLIQHKKKRSIRRSYDVMLNGKYCLS